MQGRPSRSAARGLLLLALVVSLIFSEDWLDRGLGVANALTLEATPEGTRIDRNPYVVET